MTILLDTHIWIWWHTNPDNLSKKVFEIIKNKKYDELLVSAISLWEFCKLLEKKKLGIMSDPPAWMEQALNMVQLRLVPLTPTIVYHSTNLPQPFHGDPADQIIVATAREEKATLLTKDARLRKYDHVRTIW